MIPSMSGSATGDDGTARLALDLSLMAREEALPDGRYLVLYRARWLSAVDPRSRDLPPTRSAPPSYRAAAAEG